MTPNGTRMGLSGVPLTTDADTIRVAPIRVTRGGQEQVLPVKYALLPYVRLREMVFAAQRAADADSSPDAKSALSRFQDAHLLAAIREVDGIPFDSQVLLSIMPDIGRELIALLDSAGVVDEGKSGPSSAMGPPPVENSQRSPSP